MKLKIKNLLSAEYRFARLAVLLTSLAVPLLLRSQTHPITQRLTFRVELNRMEPTEVTIAPGEYVIAIENTTFLGGWTFRVDDSLNQKIAGASMPHRSTRAVQVVTFSAGVHKISIPGKPEWAATIKVQAKP